MSLQGNSSNCDCNECHDDVLKFLEKIVDETKSYSDLYFESHPIEDAINKDKNTEYLIQKNLNLFNTHEKQGLGANKSYYYYLKGKLLNIYHIYSKEAELLLSKALKLDPKLVDAWNELGECYSKNEEWEKAKTCIERALKEKRNKISLRHLSIMMRQETTTNREQKLENYNKGINLAKEAIQLDPLDGESWVVLGNAYLSSFFGIQQHPNTLKQCLSAYSQAEKDNVAKTSPDLHHNRGITFQYLEEYKSAIESFDLSCSYAPSWEIPKMKQQHLLKYLQELQELVATKGKLKPKKLQQILQSIHSKQLGPYSGGCYTSSAGQKANLTETSYESLVPGLNQEKVILGKVICSVRSETVVPFTFCSIDKCGNVIVTTVFNMGDGKGVIIGDSVAIPEPFVTDVDFSYRDINFKFRMVRVETPVIMVVNSKKLDRRVQADVQISISRKLD